MTFVNEQSSDDADTRAPMDMGVIWRSVRRHGVLFVLCPLLGAAIGFGVSFLSTRIYRAEVTLEPVDQNGGMAGLSGLGSQLGALPSLLGVQLGGAGKSTAASLAVLKSRQLLTQFITEHDLLTVVLAKEWDSERKQWRVHWWSDIPTIDDAYERFSKSVLSTHEDPKSGLVVVAVEWRDPVKAALWANTLVAKANSSIAQQAASEADSHIEYLNEELKKADQVELRQAIYTLIEAEIKKRMLSRTKLEYAFRVLDPAAPPAAHTYVRPMRILYLLGFFIVGAMVASILAMIRDRRR